jgi:hypothetical protein
MYRNRNIHIMELIGSVSLFLYGFIATLVSMEISWRLASRRTKKSISSSRQEVKMPQWTV